VNRSDRLLAIITIVFLAFSSWSVFAEEELPLQVDARLRVERNHGLRRFFERQIAGGAAIVSGRMHNLPGSETALVTLRFDYRTNADIALDELISQIVISTENQDGSEFSIASIDPNAIPLNPNRAPLYYSVTLYTPPITRGEGYIARIKVYGNYE